MRRTCIFAVVLALGVAACTDNPTSNPNKSNTTTATSATQGLYPPCHPGCFPAGTNVATPAGPRVIESIKPGDLVTLIREDGTTTSAPVQSTFRTDNRLVEIQTVAGSILTTTTQPLCLVAGGFRTAEDLQAGDELWRWVDGKRQSARVLAIKTTHMDAAVFNLVVGESAVFVANGFMARGKPPAVSDTRSTESHSR